MHQPCAKERSRLLAENEKYTEEIVRVVQVNRQLKAELEEERSAVRRLEGKLEVISTCVKNALEDTEHHTQGC